MHEIYRSKFAKNERVLDERGRMGEYTSPRSTIRCPRTAKSAPTAAYSRTVFADPTGFAATSLDTALALLTDGSAWASDRVALARVAALLLPGTAPTERRTATLLRALVGSVDAPAVVSPLLRALLMTVPDRGRLVAPLARLLDGAAAGCHGETTFVIVRRLLSDGVAFRAVRPDDAAVAFAWAVDHRGTDSAAALLELSIERFGVGQPWIRDAVECTPSLLASRRLSVRRKLDLHYSVPTVAGWHTFAAFAVHAWPSWEPSRFGAEFETARDTLEQAGGEATTRQRVVLARWLDELSG